MFKLHKNKLKRIYAEDEYCFVTVKTFGNQRIFKDKGKAEIFMGALRFLEKRGDFVLAAGVLLFDHFHLLLLPEKKNISQIMHDLKSYTAQKINEIKRRQIILNSNRRRGLEASPMVDDNLNNNRRGIPVSPSPVLFDVNKNICRHKGEAGSLAYGDWVKKYGLNINLPPVWQKSFYYHIIASDCDFDNHFDYILYNPLKHGYIAELEDWPYLFGDF